VMAIVIAIATALSASVALAGGAGCVSYSGAARPIDPASVRPAEGWVVAGPPPTIRQGRELDCGPAALAMVAAHWAVPLSLRDARAAVAETSEGVRLGALRDLARARGLVAFAVAGDAATIAHELDAGRPVIVGLLRPHGDRATSHYEVVIAIRGRGAEASVVTIDPGAGWRVRRLRDLEAEWSPAGRPALVVVGTERALTSAPRRRAFGSAQVCAGAPSPRTP
jgi:ABC-type bacteriocin/lantibiotic exporter with double-glycine peptidase domain